MAREQDVSAWNYEFKIKRPEHHQLPVEYEANISSFRVEGSPISFDDMVPYNMLEPLDYEIDRYERLPLPGGSVYMNRPEFMQQKQKERRGCEHEYAIRGPKGEPESYLSPDQGLIHMPETMVRPLDYDPTAVICPHPTIREYLPYKSHYKVALVPEERKREVDEESGDLTAQFLGSGGQLKTQDLPGNVSVRVMEQLPF